jgi:hypothetical protein
LTLLDLRDLPTKKEAPLVCTAYSLLFAKELGTDDGGYFKQPGNQDTPLHRRPFYNFRNVLIMYFSVI